MNRTYGIGSTVFEKWIIKRKLGEGSFGTVYEIQREDFGEVYKAALKVITVPQSDAEFQGALDEGMTRTQAEEYFYSVVEDIVREFAIMAKLKGTANVVSYEDHAVIRHKDGVGWDILIRMELLNPLLPYAYRHPMSRRDIICLGIDICKALELCQKYNVIHRDIKPENIFVSDNGDYKLGDFGIARTIERTMSGLSKKGTYNYMAPEVYRGREYGFSVDIYSLGIVLYRLLNQNRIPFLPQPPEPITFHQREEALARRMGGEMLPKPFYAEGRLAEIVQKACAYEPKERYSSPIQMRQELEAILYDEKDTEFIYPSGDELSLAENEYASSYGTEQSAAEELCEEDKEQTESAFGKAHGLQNAKDTGDEEATESAFGRRKYAPGIDPESSKTEYVFGSRSDGKPASRAKTVSVPAAKTRSPKVIIIAITAAAMLLACGIGIYMYLQASRVSRYETIMEQASTLCATDAEEALSLYLEAQSLSSKDPAPYTGYAYALYCNRQYKECISYIEDTLSLGKEYDISTQDKLSEILASAYFELEDYAQAASFFRLSTAGGDVTVSAMRDYAVSLGRMGDIDAANEVLQRMYSEGASGDVTDYVQAEVNYALKDYTTAEHGFREVLDSTEDISLQKRALRSLAELYRDCAALARINESPIEYPATKEAELLSNGIVQYGLRYDSTLWEMLALAYFEAYHTDASVDVSYLNKAAECFNLVIELGVQKDYLYSNLYTIYYEMKDYEKAELVLEDYEAAFPDDYMPHALRGMMLITIENNKSQSARDYTKAVQEYEQAGKLVESDDDQTYYQQLGSLIDQLNAKGWL